MKTYIIDLIESLKNEQRLYIEERKAHGSENVSEKLQKLQESQEKLRKNLWDKHKELYELYLKN